MIVINVLSSGVLDKSMPLDVGNGAMYAIVSIIMVFAILLIIIGVTSLLFKFLDMVEDRKTNKTKNDIKEEINKDVDFEDEDLMAGILVATIDYRNEVKKDVRVVSVKRIK